MTSKREFARIFKEAYAAGMKAGNTHTPIPMVVSQHANALDDSSPIIKQWHVPSGVCGFAWVHIAGNTAFGRWAKQDGCATPDYPTGLMFWCREFGQSMERKGAWASAFAQVLQDNGIKAYSQTRMD